MKPWLTIRIFGIAFLVVSSSFQLGAVDQIDASKFNPPDITFATGIPYPDDGLAGILDLLVNLDGSARVQYVQVLREVPPLTGSSLVAVNNWTFAAGNVDGKPLSGNLPVNIIFNPRNLVPQIVPLPVPALQSQPPEPSEFTPPQVVEAWYAAYPEHGDDSGTLVLDVTVNEAGRVSHVSIVRSRAASLEKPVVDAVEKWTFKPATLGGSPIPSHMIVAFVFRASTIPSR